MKFLKDYAWAIITGLLAATVVVLLLPYFAPNNPGNRPFTASRQVSSYADAVDLAAPSVVNIYTLKKLTVQRHPLLNDPFFRRFFNQRDMPQRQRMESSLGSGVIVSEEGFILTNYHVIDGADEIITLLHDGREAHATIVGTDLETDLAVLKINLDDLEPTQVRNSANLQVGDVVLAIGNPFGVGQSVSQGIISATGRTDLGLNLFENFIQTDAAINPGNSGGALVDASGQLVGINSAILNESSSVGIGFAIPANTAMKVLGDIIRHGRVIRGWLGVEAQHLSPEMAARLELDPPIALIITDVHPHSPALAAGLLVGDIVTHINGQRIGKGSSGMHLIAGLAPGDPIELDVIRRQTQLRISARAGTRPPIN